MGNLESGGDQMNHPESAPDSNDPTSLTEKQQLALHIQQLEAQLIHKTNEVLKSTDLLKEFKHYRKKQLKQKQMIV